MAEKVVAARYRLLEQLSAGWMSEVWIGHDLELDRRVAVKLLGYDADAERFEREAQAVAALSHPNICRLYDYGESEGRPYIVLELLGGGSLEDRLSAGGPLPDAAAAEIAMDLASALAYAHGQGVVHRDVKPINILFDDDGRAKLADFGIARLTGASTLTEAGTVLGTAAYLSPEQASGAPVGPASDVYAFGVILYRMLTGSLPFEAENALQVAAMHATEDPEPIASRRPDAPPRLERVASDALAKRPDDRPADGSALLAALAEDVEEETQVLLPAARRLRPRHLAAGAALALLAATGAALAFLAAPEPSRAPVTATSELRTTGARRTESAGVSTAPSTAATTATTEATTTRPTTAPTSPPPPPPPSTATAPTTAPTTTETIPTETTPTATTGTTTTAATTTVP